MTTASAVGATTLVVNKPTGVVQNDLMVAVWWTGTTPTAPSGWTTALSQIEANTICVVSWKIAGGSEGSTYTFTQTASDDIAAQIQAFQGGSFNASTPIGTPLITGYATTTTTMVAPTVTPSVANSLLMSVFVNQDSNTGVATAPSGMTLLALTTNTDGEEQASYYQQLTSTAATGTRTLVWTTTGLGAAYQFIVNQ